MSSETAAAEAAPKATRADEVRRARRHERGETTVLGYKLGVNEKELDRKNYVYRFVNDTPGRIDAFTKGGEWDIVDDRSKTIKSDATGEGTGVSVVAGVGTGGAPMRTVLLRKPKWIHDEDRAAKMAEQDKLMESIARGKPQTDGKASDLDGTSYVPAGGINIGADR